MFLTRLSLEFQLKLTWNIIPSVVSLFWTPHNEVIAGNSMIIRIKYLLRIICWQKLISSISSSFQGIPRSRWNSTETSHHRAERIVPVTSRHRRTSAASWCHRLWARNCARNTTSARCQSARMTRFRWVAQRAWFMTLWEVMLVDQLTPSSLFCFRTFEVIENSIWNSFRSFAVTTKGTKSGRSCKCTARSSSCTLKEYSGRRPTAPTSTSASTHRSFWSSSSRWTRTARESSTVAPRDVWPLSARRRASTQKRQPLPQWRQHRKFPPDLSC